MLIICLKFISLWVIYVLSVLLVAAMTLMIKTCIDDRKDRKKELDNDMKKKQENVLANAIVYRTVGNLKAAEEIANTLLQNGKFRNILRNKNNIRNYMAASIYLLATHLPVEVQQDKEETPADGNMEYPPLKCRSRVGDLAHFLVMMTYLPSQIFTLFAEKPEICEYLSSEFTLYRNGRNEELNKLYEQLTQAAHKIISEKKSVISFQAEHRSAMQIST